MAFKRALSGVLCVALGGLIGSCAGGPTSDWPPAAGGDDDTEQPGMGEPPKGGLDAGSSTGFQDAGRVPTDTRDGGDEADADASADAAADAGLMIPGPDAGDPIDATVPDDASRSADAESSP